MPTPVMTESERQRALDAYRILDTLPEPAFDDLARVAAAICDVPMAAVTLIDRGRQWFKAGIGIDAVESTREDAFCNHTIQSPATLTEIPDATVDDRVRDTRFVTGELGQVRFYAGAPLVTPSGAAIGALCVIDESPRQLNDRQREALSSLARIAMNLLEARHQLQGAERDRTLEAVAPPPTEATPRPYALAIIELQGHAAQVKALGHRHVERMLGALEAAVQAALPPGRGDSVSRASDSPEAIVVMHGPDAEATVKRVRKAVDDFARGNALDLRIGSAHAASPDEPAHDVFMRADFSLSASKDATPD